jgi:hypothetical protein
MEEETLAECGVEKQHAQRSLEPAERHRFLRPITMTS